MESLPLRRLLGPFERARGVYLSKGGRSALNFLRKELVTLCLPRGSRLVQKYGHFQTRESHFDLTYGVETEGDASPWHYDLPHHKKLFAERYQPVSEATFRAVLDARRISPEEFQFVDFGAGKGRALLLAAMSGFLRVRGVELVPELADIARRNIELARSRLGNADISVLTGDALDAEIDWSLPTVVFLFNPFDWAVLDPLLTRIEMANDTGRTVNGAAPHEVELWYINPAWRAQLDARDRWRLVEAVGDAWAIYRLRERTHSCPAS